MLSQKKVDALRHGWNERAAEMFVASASETDGEEQARVRGCAETFTICAQELKKAAAED